MGRQATSTAVQRNVNPITKAVTVRANILHYGSESYQRANILHYGSESYQLEHFSQMFHP